MADTKDNPKPPPPDKKADPKTETAQRFDEAQKLLVPQFLKVADDRLGVDFGQLMAEAVAARTRVQTKLTFYSDEAGSDISRRWVAAKEHFANRQAAQSPLDAVKVTAPPWYKVTRGTLDPSLQAAFMQRVQAAQQAVAKRQEEFDADFLDIGQETRLIQVPATLGESRRLLGPGSSLLLLTYSSPDLPVEDDAKQQQQQPKPFSPATQPKAHAQGNIAIPGSEEKKVLPSAATMCYVAELEVEPFTADSLKYAVVWYENMRKVLGNGIAKAIQKEAVFKMAATRNPKVHENHAKVLNGVYQKP